MTDTGDSLVTIKDLWQAQQAQADRLAGALGLLEQAVSRLTGHLDAIDAHAAAADRIDADHEVRIRALERWRYALPASALVAAGSAAAAVVAAVNAAH